MLLHPIDFWITVFTFSFVSRYFKIYSVTNLLFSSMLFSLHMFVLFLQFFAEISSLIQCGQKWCLLWFQFLKNYWDLFCGLTCALSWRMFNVHLKRLCVLLILGGMIYICYLIWYNMWFMASVSLLIFCLDDLSIDESGVLKSTTITALL